ncbi:hypothetical protein C8J57DRAFT_1238531 [Mycena rebaudengoi]|nr:hypothetical protein C8J57DRAFT_1238531 [Mycena rebaudengoi]
MPSSTWGAMMAGLGRFLLWVGGRGWGWRVDVRRELPVVRDGRLGAVLRNDAAGLCRAGGVRQVCVKRGELRKRPAWLGGSCAAADAGRGSAREAVCVAVVAGLRRLGVRTLLADFGRYATDPGWTFVYFRASEREEQGDKHDPAGLGRLDPPPADAVRERSMPHRLSTEAVVPSNDQ